MTLIIYVIFVLLVFYLTAAKLNCDNLPLYIKRDLYCHNCTTLIKRFSKSFFRDGLIRDSSQSSINDSWRDMYNTLHMLFMS